VVGFCCCPCETWTDNFNKPNSDYIGDRWCESVGKWRIEDNALVTDEAGAIAVWKVNQAIGQGVFQAYIKDPASGVIYRASAFHGITPADCELNEHIGMTLQIYGTSPSYQGKMSLEIYGQPPYPVISGLSITSDTYLELCVGSGKISAAVYPSINSYQWDCIDGNDGWHFAVEAGIASVTGVKYDKVILSEHLDHVAACPTCKCLCDNTCMHRTLTLTAVDSQHECAYGYSMNIDGMSWTISGIDSCHWKSASFLWPYVFIGSGHWDLQNTTLRMVEDSNMSSFTASGPDPRVCDPLSLYYSGLPYWQIPDPIPDPWDCSTGYFSVEITE
jgi:hypothetical protein